MFFPHIHNLPFISTFNGPQDQSHIISKIQIINLKKWKIKQKEEDRDKIIISSQKIVRE